jgi:hypothetical protein
MTSLIIPLALLRACWLRPHVFNYAASASCMLRSSGQCGPPSAGPSKHGPACLGPCCSQLTPVSERVAEHFSSSTRAHEEQGLLSSAPQKPVHCKRSALAPGPSLETARQRLA